MFYITTCVAEENETDCDHEDPPTLNNFNNKRRLNILLSGETGVGKSTWINGFVNYLALSGLEEATESKRFIWTIPVSFTVYDANMVERRISIGKDDNEQQETGKSATRSSQTYVFYVGDVEMHVIDTIGGARV